MIEDGALTALTLSVFSDFPEPERVRVSVAIYRFSYNHNYSSSFLFLVHITYSGGIGLLSIKYAKEAM